MSSNNKRLIHTYAYDALDRHIKSGSSGADVTQLFYCQKRLITEIKGTVSTHLFETEHVVLAQHALQGSAHTTTLIAGDDKRSTLALLNNSQPQPLAYNPYGHSAELPMLHLMAGFNGERRDPLSGYYLLGNGYRAFNPTLMRFNSPDSLSPFGDGGINAYAYCGGDPVNRGDSTGHTWAWLKRTLRGIGVMSKGPSRKERLLQRIATQKGLDIEKLTEETIRQQKYISSLQYDLKKNKFEYRNLAIHTTQEIASLDDQVKGLMAINKKLVTKNSMLQNKLKLRNKPPHTRMPPIVPERPPSTLTNNSSLKEFSHNELDYLDLASSATQVRQ